MARLTDRQIAGAAVLGGLAESGNVEDIALWTAIGLAESSGITDNISWTRCCVGIWQVHSRVWLGQIPGAPANEADFRNWLKVPLNNARAAAHIKRSQGISAWDGYTDGRFRQFMSRGRTAARNPDITSIAQDAGSDAGIIDTLTVAPEALFDVATEPIEQVVDILEDVADPIIAVSKWLGNPSNWVRIIQVGGGVILGIAAMSIVAKPVIATTTRTIRGG